MLAIAGYTVINTAIQSLDDVRIARDITRPDHSPPALKISAAECILTQGGPTY